MYAIMGITGQVGSAVAEDLFAQGKQIRAIVRSAEMAASWKDRGAEIAVADYDDPNALASAFEGAACSSLKGSSEESRLPFLDRSRTEQRVGNYHQLASHGAKARRSTHRPCIPEGWLVHGKSCLGRSYSTVRGQNLF